MKLYTSLAAAAVATALALTISACSSDATDSTDTATGSTDTATASDDTSSEGLKIGLILLQGDTYFQNIQTGVEAAAAKDGGTVTTALSNGDPGTENEAALNMIQAQVDAILMQPAADEASLATMKAIRDAGITLICYGNCVGPTADPANVDGAIQSDNTALGTQTGEAAAAYITENIGDEVNVAILNCDVASACKLRKAGFLGALADAGITASIATDQEGYLVDKATPVAQNILAANPDIDMIWASNDGGTAGAVIATQQAGSTLPVFGTDISTQLAEFLLEPDGNLQATTGQDAFGTAEGAYDMAVKVHAGETLAEPFVELPGITYDRTDSDTIQAFLDQ